MRPRTIALLAAAALAAVALGVLAFTLTRPAAPLASAADITLDTGAYQPQLDACLAKTERPGESSDCVKKLVHTATQDGQIGASLAMLRSAVERSSDFVGRCHNEAHLVGEHAVEMGMPLLEVYKVPFPDCRFGFYHGGAKKVQESMNLEEFTAAMPQLCAYFGDGGQDATQECVHVLGHFIVDRIGTDLPGSLARCTVFDDPRLQSRCIDGVFMQAVELARPGVEDATHEAAKRIPATWGSTRPEQEQTMRAACTSMTVPESRYVCATAVSQTLAVLWKQDYAAVHQVCSALDPVDQQPCFEGVAASAFSMRDWSPEGVADACHASQDPGTKYCMASMAFTFGIQDTSGRADQVCTLARDWEAEECHNGLNRGLAASGRLQQGQDGPAGSPADGQSTGDGQGRS